MKRFFNVLFLAFAGCAHSTSFPVLKQCPDLNLSSTLKEIVGPSDLKNLGLSVVVINTKGEKICEGHFQEKQIIYPASAMKTLVAMSTLEMIDRGELDLKQKITIDRSNADQECAPYDCSLYGKGRSVTVDKLLRDMIVVSNNLATNQLIQLNSKERINQLAERLEAQIVIYRGVYSTVNPEPEIKQRNEATTLGLVNLYREVATGQKQILSENKRQFLAELLKEQLANDHLGYHFPKGIVFYHKPGATSNSSSDAGYFYLNEEQVVIVAALQNFYNPKSLQQIGQRIIKLFQ